MRLSDAGEMSLLDILRKRFGKTSSSILLGIGDDAAVIRQRKSHLLLTTDMMVEGMHFDLSWTTAYQLGFKIVSVNVSDIYAMDGEPQFLLLDFSAGNNATLGFFSELFDGIEAAMGKYGVSLVGGDISASGKVVLSATMIGYAGKILSRKGARTGERIYVTGHLGNAACGLALMKLSRKKIAIERSKKQEFPLP